VDPVVLSIAALAVSVAAAGFTAWQAVTAHLERTRPKPAVLTLLKDGVDWMIENGGGSTASRVTLTFTYEYQERRGETVTAGVHGDVPAGQRRKVDDSSDRGGRFIVEGTMVREGSKGRRPKPGERGHRILAERVRVDWTDYRGKRRVSTVLLP